MEKMNTRKNKQTLPWVFLCLIIFLLVLNLLVDLTNSHLAFQNGTPVIQLDEKLLSVFKDKTEPDANKKIRQIAEKLHSYGYLDSAVSFYELYFSKLDKNQDTGTIYYQLALDYMKRSNHEKAFVYLLKAELSEADQNLKEKIMSQQIRCLEQSGRTKDADDLISEKIKPFDKTKDLSNVVASFGGHLITLKQLNDDIEKQPEFLQKKINMHANEKSKWLKQFILKKILYQKAMRLGMDQDPEVLKKIENMKAETLINLMLKTELEKFSKPGQNELKINLSESFIDDAKNQNQRKQERLQKVMLDLFKNEKVKIFENFIVSEPVPTEKQDKDLIN